MRVPQNPREICLTTAIMNFLFSVAGNQWYSFTFDLKHLFFSTFTKAQETFVLHKQLMTKLESFLFGTCICGLLSINTHSKALWCSIFTLLLQKRSVADKETLFWLKRCPQRTALNFSLHTSTLLRSHPDTYLSTSWTQTATCVIHPDTSTPATPDTHFHKPPIHFIQIPTPYRQDFASRHLDKHTIKLGHYWLLWVVTPTNIRPVN